MDKFLYFATVPKEIQELLAQYRSPEGEASIWKWIPVCYLDQAMTWKEDAVAFTVYPL